MSLTLLVYRHGSDDPDVCEFENRREYLEAERQLRSIIRRHRRRRERPIYGEPMLALPGSSPTGHYPIVNRGSASA